MIFVKKNIGTWLKMWGILQRNEIEPTAQPDDPENSDQSHDPGV